MAIISHNGEILGGYIQNTDGYALVRFDQTSAYRSATDLDFGSAEYVPWFKSDGNAFANSVIELLTQNNINPGILKTKQSFIMGDGIVRYREEFKKGKRTAILIDPTDHAESYDWLESSNYTHEARQTVLDLLWFGNASQVFNFKNNKIVRVDHLDFSCCRIEKYTKKVENYLVCSNWQKWRDHAQENSITKIPAYYREQKRPYLCQRLLHLKDYMPGYPDYALPSWYGALNWIKLANLIPIWHISGIKNGYNIRWHIQIPESYFEKFEPDKQAEAKERLIKEMNRWLSGAENVGTAFISFKKANGTEYDLFTLTPLESQLNDDAFTLLFEQSNMAMTGAHGMAPSLAGVETAGKLSSGSEMRNAYSIWIASHAKLYRELILKALREVSIVNGWDKTIKFGIKDTDITTLDQNPTGKQSVISN